MTTGQSWALLVILWGGLMLAVIACSRPDRAALRAWRIERRQRRLLRRRARRVLRGRP